jgi:hypothetical protein
MNYDIIIINQLKMNIDQRNKNLNLNSSIEIDNNWSSLLIKE